MAVERNLAFLIVSVLIVSTPRTGRSEDSGGQDKTRSRLEQWQRVGLNRETAAANQTERAAELLDQARRHRLAHHKDEADRKKAFARAGTLELAAAKMYAAASRNYDESRSSWLSLAKLANKSSRHDKAERAGAWAAIADKTAGETGQLAAHAYELAAEAFSRENADHLEKSAEASELAATWWEKLISRN